MKPTLRVSGEYAVTIRSTAHLTRETIVAIVALALDAGDDLSTKTAIENEVRDYVWAFGNAGADNAAQRLDRIGDRRPEEWLSDASDLVADLLGWPAPKKETVS